MPYSNPESAPRLADLFSLKGRTALVIGGSGLLGGQISYAFAELGAELIIASRNLERTSQFVDTLKQQFPGLELQVADDGIAGLAMVGQLKPQVLIVDILLPGIDGATLITSLRSHPQFSGCRLIVVTSLDAAQRAPYAFALEGVPVVHKPDLVTALPPLLRDALAPA